MKIHIKYRGCWWWRVVHYNYFHKKLFKNFYLSDATREKRHLPPPTKFEIKKYHLYQKIDDIITLRRWDRVRILIWKLE